MASRETHNWICKTFLGNDCNAVNNALDYPSRFLGAEHRKLFHDVPTACIIGLLFSNDKVKGVCAALLHLVADDVKI